MSTHNGLAATEGDLMEFIRARLGHFPEVGDWPDLKELIDREIKASRPTWLLALDACETVGGDRRRAWTAAAVVYCLLYSIHLVDDILDEDPQGMQHRFGVGGSANGALGFQSVGNLLIGDLELPPAIEVAAQRALGQACLGTAYGQMLDSQNLAGEENYWRVIDLKTPPLFSFAFYLGALVGCEDIERAEQLAQLGLSLGRIVQVSDDLHDALERPAAPDWQRQATNLAILDGLTADHPEKGELMGLCARLNEGEALQRAQEILVRCGAFSYCSYQMVQAYRMAQAEIEGMDLPNSAVMTAVFDYHLTPLRRLLKSVGVEAPEELFKKNE